MTYRSRGKIPCRICGKLPIMARFLCKSCYYKAKNKKTLNKYPLPKPEDVFMLSVKKTSTCWIWTGTKHEYGYGIFLLPGEVHVRAHRYSYEFHVRKIPKNKIVMHTCDNPICVNPSHLRIGTRADNNRDSVKKRRHAFGEKNGHARLKTKDIIEIRKSDSAQHKLAKKFKVSQSHISRILSREVRHLE